MKIKEISYKIGLLKIPHDYSQIGDRVYNFWCRCGANCKDKDGLCVSCQGTHNRAINQVLILLKEIEEAE